MTAVRNADGRLEVFGIGYDDALIHIWQLEKGEWSDWESLSHTLIGQPGSSRNSDGRLEVFALSPDFFCGISGRREREGLGLRGHPWEARS